MPDWLIPFLPGWETAMWCVAVGATATQIWKQHRLAKDGRKPPKRKIALVAIVVTFLVALPSMWAETRDLAKSFARALLIGGASPVVWEGFQRAVRKWAPWLAAMFGEERRNGGDPTYAGPRRRKREWLEDTGDTSTTEVRKWREQLDKGRKDG